MDTDFKAESYNTVGTEAGSLLQRIFVSNQMNRPKLALPSKSKVEAFLKYFNYRRV